MEVTTIGIDLAKNVPQETSQEQENLKLTQPDSTVVDEVGESVDPRRTGGDEPEPCTTELG